MKGLISLGALISITIQAASIDITETSAIDLSGFITTSKVISLKSLEVRSFGHHQAVTVRCQGGSEGESILLPLGFTAIINKGEYLVVCDP